MLGVNQINLSRAVMGLSSALDLVSRNLSRHHLQTTTITGFLGQALGLSGVERSHLGIASALHDIGAIAFNRECELFADESKLTDHAEIGWMLLKSFPPFAAAAEIVRYHHTAWIARDEAWDCHERVKLMSQIVHLADRVAVQIKPEIFILGQNEAISQSIIQSPPGRFAPEVIAAFREIACRDSFWLETAHASHPQMEFSAGNGCAWTGQIDSNLLLQLSELFRMIIDFRSKHTATHSKSVAAVAETLARLIGFSGYSCSMMHVAGNLHDLGKLAVPVAILDKPAGLSAEERALVRSHPYYTRQILQRIGGLDEMVEWAASHHEHLDGTGYPCRITEETLSLGARIVATADIFSALGENRPYRPAMSRQEILALMRTMGQNRQLDPIVLCLVEQNFDELSSVRHEAAISGELEFKKLRAAAAVFHNPDLH